MVELEGKEKAGLEAAQDFHIQQEKGHADH